LLLVHSSFRWLANASFLAHSAIGACVQVQTQLSIGCQARSYACSIAQLSTRQGRRGTAHRKYQLGYFFFFSSFSSFSLATSMQTVVVVVVAMLLYHSFLPLVRFSLRLCAVLFPLRCHY